MDSLAVLFFSVSHSIIDFDNLTLVRLLRLHSSDTPEQHVRPNSFACDSFFMHNRTSLHQIHQLFCTYLMGFSQRYMPPLSRYKKDECNFQLMSLKCLTRSKFQESILSSANHLWHRRWILNPELLGSSEAFTLRLNRQELKGPLE